MIEIGTNFDYKAPFFLDARQYVTIPDGKTYYEVLYDWNIPIPDGFEVFCGGKWWTYGEANPITTTGKFKQRSGGGGGSDEYSLSLTSPSGSSLYIPYNGSITSTTVSWETRYGGDIVTPSSLVIILNGVSYTPQEMTGIGTFAINNVNIVGGNILTVNSTFGTDASNRSVRFVSTYTKYYGALPNETIQSSDLGTLARLQNSTSAALNESYDCTGGKYPYYVLPKALYTPVEDRIKMYVNGCLNTAYTVSELEVGSETYTVIRHDIQQTGIMDIKFTI